MTEKKTTEKTHLLGASFYGELFQHHIVSPDGRIIANDEDMQHYIGILEQQSKDKIARLYTARKVIFDDVQELLKVENRTNAERDLLKKLLDELDLEYDEDKEKPVRVKEPKKQTKRYLGHKEPQKSIFEREIEAELLRIQILKRDLKILDDWLEQVSLLTPAPAPPKKDPAEWKEDERKFRKRTRSRMGEMEKARAKLIKSQCSDQDNRLQKILDPGLVPKDKYLKKASVPPRPGGTVASSKNKDAASTKEKPSSPAVVAAADKDVDKGGASGSKKPSDNSRWSRKKASEDKDVAAGGGSKATGSKTPSDKKATPRKKHLQTNDVGK